MVLHSLQQINKKYFTAGLSDNANQVPSSMHGKPIQINHLVYTLQTRTLTV